MTEIGVYEAKTHLPELLGRVAQGEHIVITKHGSPVALLSPAGPKRTTTAETIEEIKKLRKGIRSKRHRIKELIEEGRR
jgi:prevent-host-death family protein